MAFPERATLVAGGNSWVIGNTTGYDSVAAVPTTAGKFDVYNGDSALSMIIDKIEVGLNVVDATQSNASQLVFCLNTRAGTVPTQVACKQMNLSCKTQQANATSGTLDKTVVGTGTTIVNTGWFTAPDQFDFNAAAVAGSVMRQINSNVHGLIVLPPTAIMSLAVIQAAAVTAACFFNVFYHRANLVLG